jgi:hypothetical protein
MCTLCQLIQEEETSNTISLDTKVALLHFEQRLSYSTSKVAARMSNWQPGHRPSQDSVSSLAYPLSPVLVARLQSSFLLSGLGDALQYKRAIEAIQTNPFIRSQVTKCSLLQAFILVCVLSVDWLLLPAWTRDSGRADARGRTRITEEQARFYFQVISLLVTVS